MVISSSDIYQLCCIIAEQRNLNVCVTEAAKAGLITGGVTFLSALVLGPLAIIPAAAAGGLVANRACKRYVPLYQILTDMSEADKQKFLDHMHRIVLQLEITDVMALMAIASAPTSSTNYGRMLTGMGTYFQQNW